MSLQLALTIVVSGRSPLDVRTRRVCAKIAETENYLGCSKMKRTRYGHLLHLAASLPMVLVRSPSFVNIVLGGVRELCGNKRGKAGKWMNVEI